ncbi:MAG: alpha/beta fold hydrolase, partial [Pseudomonadota bacterium]
MSMEKILAGDGTSIAAQFNIPEGEIKGGVLIVGAMGVPQSFYQPLAEWLAGEGYAAATFDYRGMGASRNGSLRGLKADILDWARLDAAAALEALAARAPGAPLYWIGHSLGGQILPFVPNLARVAKAVTVATGSGYWLENAPGLRWRAWFLWYVVAPLALPLAGYFPGARLGMVGDLPAGVMRQWRRWCLQREYAVGDGEHVRAQYAAVRTPIVSLSFHDDEFMSARNIESIHGFYVNAPRTMKRLAPREVGARRI